MSQHAQSKLFVWGGLVVAGIFSIFLGLWWRERPEHRYDAQIVAAARKYNLDPALIKAVIWQESRFDAKVRGKAGEIGLMQVREDAAFEWADAERVHPFEHERILDPQTNILCGSFYLSKLLKRYQKTDNPIAYALADYNAGRSHVLRWNKGPAQTNSAAFLAQMDYPGTRRYAANILTRYERYKRQFSVVQ